MLTRVYGSSGQADVYRAQLKMIRRKKGESLTDLAQEIRRLMVLAFPGPADRTTDVVARDVFIKALEYTEPAIPLQGQRPADLDAALRVAQHMKAVMKSLLNKSSKLVRTVVQGTTDPRVEAEFRELKGEQKHLLDVLKQRVRPVPRRSASFDGTRERSPAVAVEWNARRGASSKNGVLPLWTRGSFSQSM